jgi:hypothetical protein
MAIRLMRPDGDIHAAHSHPEPVASIFDPDT